MSSNENTEPIIKKRRGRQPKKKVEIDTNQIIKPTRRGRKPKNKFNTAENIESHHMNLLNNIDDNLIIKLPIECIDENYDKFNNKPNNFFELKNNDYDIANNNQENNVSIFNNEGNNNLDDTIDKSNSINSINNIIDNKLENNNSNLNNNSSENIKNYDYNNIGGITSTNNYADFDKMFINKNEKKLNSVYYKQYKNFTNDIYNNNDKKKLKQIDILLDKKYKQIKNINLMNNLCHCLNNDNWILKTDIACFWCCHQFDYVPWGIPEKYENNHFNLSGLFCTPNCALSYLTSNEHNNIKLWEKISLLNLLYFKVYNEYTDLVPAPDKMILKLFGGPFSIEEYRAFTLDNNKNYNIMMPPSYLVIPMCEESNIINEKETSYIPIVNDNLDVQNKLKIKRTYSIYKNKNTLEKCMSIQYM
jgi:hypothetical protein